MTESAPAAAFQPNNDTTESPATRDAPGRAPIGRATWLVALAALIGVAVDVLFYGKSLGLSFPVFAVVCLGCLAAAVRQSDVKPSLKAIWLTGPILVLSAMVSVRAEPLTTFVNVSLTVGLLVLLARDLSGGQLFRFGMLDFAAAYLMAGLEILLRPWAALLEAAREMSSTPGKRLVRPILAGLVLALPLVGFFSLLLVSADLVFADRFHDVLAALKLDNIPELVLRLMLIGMAAFAALGLLVQATRPKSSPLVGAAGDFFPRIIGIVESGIVLVSLNLLFAGFVVIQFRYLFGGAQAITGVGYTYSDYARRGFGELTAVVFFSLVVLLALGSIVKLGQAGWVYKALNLILVGQVGVIAISALERLLLYEDIYGFTRLRTYAHVAIIWLALLFVPFLAALFANRLRLFAPGALIATIAFGLTMNWLNVDAFIVQQNLSRYTRGHELHTRYLITLSDDAIPALAAQFAKDDASVNQELGPGLACHQADLRAGYALSSWQTLHSAHQTALETLTTLNGLGHYPVAGAAESSTVVLDGAATPCGELLQSYVLEPGLTSEYRDSP